MKQKVTSYVMSALILLLLCCHSAISPSAFLILVCTKCLHSDRLSDHQVVIVGTNLDFLKFGRLELSVKHHVPPVSGKYVLGRMGLGIRHCTQFYLRKLGFCEKKLVPDSKERGKDGWEGETFSRPVADRLSS